MDPKLPTIDPFKKDDEEGRAPRGAAPSSPVPDSLKNEPERIQARGASAPKNPLEVPSSGEAGAQHRFAPIHSFQKKADVPHAVGDGPVSVRGPFKKELSKGTEYMTATLNFRKREKAQAAKEAYTSGEKSIRAERAIGPREAELPDGQGKYYVLMLRVPVDQDNTPKQLDQLLRKAGASEVTGPEREGHSVRFELVVQKRSGSTETLMYKSEDEAKAARDDIEKGIKDNPVQGVVARRIGSGVSSLRNRNIRPDSYFSEKQSLARKHYRMLAGEDPEYPDKAAALKKIANDIGLTLAIDPGPKDKAGQMEREMLRRTEGPERAAKMISNAKDQLQAYLGQVRDARRRSVESEQELEKLKPDFAPGFDGQVHRVKGQTRNWTHQYIDKKTGELKKVRGQSQANRELEFIGYKGKWYTPTQYHAVRRGATLPTKQLEPQDHGPGWKKGEQPPENPVFTPKQAGKDADELPAHTAAQGKKFAVGKRSGGGSGATPVKVGGKTLAPDDPRYAEEYTKILTAVGQHYMQSPLTQAMGEAMMGVVRTTQKHGSPTEASLTKLADALLTLQQTFEERGNSLTPRGLENLERAIHAGNLVVSQPPPIADEYEQPDEYEQDPRALAGGARRLQNRLGMARPRAPETAPEKPRSRKHVAVAPGLPPKLADRIPREYLKGQESGWKELDYMLRGGDDSEFGAPRDSSAWRALKDKLGHRLTKLAAPAEPEASTPPPESKGTKAAQSAPSDTPWRALAKLQAAEEEREPEREPA